MLPHSRRQATAAQKTKHHLRASSDLGKSGNQGKVRDSTLWKISGKNQEILLKILEDLPGKK